MARPKFTKEQLQIFAESPRPPCNPPPKVRRVPPHEGGGGGSPSHSPPQPQFQCNLKKTVL